MASPSEIMIAVTDWLVSKIRVDEITINPPVNTSTLINGNSYPSNTLRVLPPEAISVQKTGTDDANAVFYQGYEILYRFNGDLPPSELPIDHAHNLVANIYYFAALDFKDIHVSIVRLQTSPDDAVFYGRIEDESNDWIISIRIGFEIEYVLNVGDVFKLQPDGFVIPERIYTVYFDLNRSYYPINPKDEDNSTLFSRIEIHQDSEDV